MKRRSVRAGDELTDETTVVVRGGSLEPTVLRSDASRMHSVYGVYGISVFAVRDLTLDELAQQAPLVRFANLTVASVGALGAAGLTLEPTGRNPRHFTVVFAELEDGIARLLGADHRTMANPYHDA